MAIEGFPISTWEPDPNKLMLPGELDDFDRDIVLAERGPGTPLGEGPTRVSVQVDTWVDRPDLGPGSRTFVQAHDMIPVGLEGFPRNPA